MVYSSTIKMVVIHGICFKYGMTFRVQKPLLFHVMQEVACCCFLVQLFYFTESLSTVLVLMKV